MSYLGNEGEGGGAGLASGGGSDADFGGSRDFPGRQLEIDRVGVREKGEVGWSGYFAAARGDGERLRLGSDRSEAELGGDRGAALDGGLG